MSDDEIEETEVPRVLEGALSPPPRDVPEDRIAALRALVEARAAERVASPAVAPAEVVELPRSPARRTVLVGSIAAAIGAAAGSAGVLATQSRDGDDEAAVPTQPVTFASVPPGASVDGRTIDHTWGMELLLDVEGLPLGRAYDVTFTTAEGPVGAGGFLSVDALMICRFNATVLRDAVQSVEVVDQQTGEVALRGTLV